jgi:CheY-like chemotaxis protein
MWFYERPGESSRDPRGRFSIQVIMRNMSTHLLSGFRVLVVEDEYLLADDLCHSLTAAGAIVIGPAYSVQGALALLGATPVLDGAVLDINLNGEMVFPVADALAQRGVPFVFATGYDEDMPPERYSSVPHCGKPVHAASVADAIRQAIFAYLSPTERRRRTMGLEQ